MPTTLLALGAALLLASAAPAQTLPAAQVSAAAKATFKARFPTANATTWGKEGATYEAGFQVNGKTMSAVITPAGTLRETETAMAVAELPAAVRATLARNYRAYKVTEASTIVRADGTTRYEAEVAKDGTTHDVLFTASGRVAAY